MPLLFWKKTKAGTLEMAPSRGIKEAVLTAKPTHPVTAIELDSRLATLATANLLPIEKAQMSIVRGQLESEKLACEFRELDMSFLKWQRKDKLPVFGVFDPESSNITCNFQIYGSLKEAWWMEVHGSALERLIIPLYGDALYRSSSSERIQALFTGLLPSSTREKFHQCRQRFDKVILIAESEWKMVPMPPDPLLVGIKGNRFWLIDAFDITPLENIVKSEFTL